jgi:hypothetical protein
MEPANRHKLAGTQGITGRNSRVAVGRRKRTDQKTNPIAIQPVSCSRPAQWNSTRRRRHEQFNTKRDLTQRRSDARTQSRKRRKRGKEEDSPFSRSPHPSAFASPRPGVLALNFFSEHFSREDPLGPAQNSRFPACMWFKSDLNPNSKLLWELGSSAAGHRLGRE